MANACINVKPVKGGSEEHNKRTKALDYVRPDLPHDYWQSQSQAEVLASIKERYKASKNQTLQKSATPIREGVVLIEEGTTLSDLRQLADKIQQEFGVRTFQIALHLDEGHWDEKTHQWNPNRHAHLVFDWTNEDGTTIKLNRNDMSRMQTMVADHLHMKRGHSSDKEHLTAQQYKIGKEIEKLNERLAEAQKTGLIDSLKVAALDKVECSQTYQTMQAANEQLTTKLATATAERDEARQLVEGMRRGNLIFSDRMDALEKEKEQLQEQCNTMQEQAELDDIWTNAWNDIRTMASGARTGTGNIKKAIAKIAEWVKVGFRMAADILLNMCMGISQNAENDIRPTMYRIADAMEFSKNQEQSFGRGR